MLRRLWAEATCKWCVHRRGFHAARRYPGQRQRQRRRTKDPNRPPRRPPPKPLPGQHLMQSILEEQPENVAPPPSDARHNVEWVLAEGASLRSRVDRALATERRRATQLQGLRRTAAAMSRAAEESDDEEGLEYEYDDEVAGVQQHETKAPAPKKTHDVPPPLSDELVQPAEQPAFPTRGYEPLVSGEGLTGGGRQMSELDGSLQVSAIPDDLTVALRQSYAQEADAEPHENSADEEGRRAVQFGAESTQPEDAEQSPPPVLNEEDWEDWEDTVAAGDDFVSAADAQAEQQIDEMARAALTRQDREQKVSDEYLEVLSDILPDDTQQDYTETQGPGDPTETPMVQSQKQPQPSHFSQQVQEQRDLLSEMINIIGGKELRKAGKEHEKSQARNAHPVNPLDYSTAPFSAASDIGVAFPLPPPLAPRSLNVGLIGLPNAGKSTVLNYLLHTKLSAVSPKRNTTRQAVYGWSTHHATQIAFVDTPGLLPASSKQFEEGLSDVAWDALDADHLDMLVVVCDAVRKWGGDADHMMRRVCTFAQQYPDVSVVLLLNKRDLCKPPVRMLGLSDYLIREYPEANISEVFYVSAHSGLKMPELESFLYEKAERRAWTFEDPTASSLSVRDRIREIVREKLFLRLHEELPYNLDHFVDRLVTKRDGSILVHYRIRVERKSQRGIVLGAQGKTIEWLRVAAEKELYRVFGKVVVLSFEVTT